MANKSKDELEQNKQENINERWFWIFMFMYIKTELKPKMGFRSVFSGAGLASSRTKTVG